jgi:hypothetical protein
VKTEHSESNLKRVRRNDEQARPTRAWPDTGFAPEVTADRSGIIVTKSSPLISAISRTPSGDYRIWGGSFNGGGGCTEATAQQVAEYLARSPHWSRLIELTKEMGWFDVHHALANL